MNVLIVVIAVVAVASVALLAIGPWVTTRHEGLSALGYTGFGWSTCLMTAMVLFPAPVMTVVAVAFTLFMALAYRQAILITGVSMMWLWAASALRF
jgi:hypothetical protein